MFNRPEFKKISEAIWYVDKTFKPGMRIPVRVIATKKLLDRMEDLVFDQITNVATLPGIVNWAVCLPDTHTGYGAPIGCVFATDPESGGIISPGAVGFDINCLSADTRVQTELGYFKPISQFQKGGSENLGCVNLKSGKQAVTKPLMFLQKKANPKIIQIETKAGYKIKATPDHPILTPNGKVEISKIKAGSKIAVSPFKGVEFKEPSNKVIVSKKDILRLEIPWNKEQIVRELEERRLLPLGYSSPKFPYLIKVLSYNLGDGSLLIIGKRKDAIAWFWGPKNDLEEIRNDIEKLGYRPSRVYARERHHKIQTNYSQVKFDTIEYSFKVGARSFASLLHALGVPFGAKAHQNYQLPNWLFKAPLWQKRLFLASYFGAEMTTPATLPEHGLNFYMPTISVNKTKKTLESGKKFLGQIKDFLKEFEIQCTGISKVDSYRGKLTETVRLRLQISGNLGNLAKFYETIGFEYSKKKRFLGAAASFYLRLKERILAKREEAAVLAKNLYQGRSSLKQIILQFVLNTVNKRFVERSIFEGRKTQVRPPFSFPTFKQFLKVQAFGDDGVFWDKVERIEEVPFSDWVYDFTVDHADHNFIANNLVVSNCGMRLVRSNLTVKEVLPRIQELVGALFREIPAGVGARGFLKLSLKELDEVMVEGAGWAVKKGFGWQKDLESIEEKGRIEGADPSKVSQRARERGLPQLGTLGSGNHYLEIQKVEEIFDSYIAKQLGIEEKDRIVLMIHCGSRGFGHQVATDYLRIFNQSMAKYKIEVLDRQLASAPFNSKEGQEYWSAMAAAANMAFANRQIITSQVRKVFAQIFGKNPQELDLSLIYDVCHNIAKIEEYEIETRNQKAETRKLVVHRKGATRAFGPGHPKLSGIHQKIGQPVIIGGSMETGSYLLVGTREAAEISFSSTCHGSGRSMSRAQAKREISGKELEGKMRERGIYVRSVSYQGLAEEAAIAYKDISEVVEAIEKARISAKVARFVPIGNVKG
jgi:tRNA-splicing ligase RtcB